jgi:hypothetical protein
MGESFLHNQIMAGNSYKVVQGNVQGSGTAGESITVTFPSKPAIILYTLVVAIGTTEYPVSNYKYDKVNSFFAPFAEKLDEDIPTENAFSYLKKTEEYVMCNKIDDYTYEFKCNYNLYPNKELTYIAILE